MARNLVRVYSYYGDEQDKTKDAVCPEPYHPCVAPKAPENHIFAMCRSRSETLTDYIEGMKSVGKDFQKPLFIQLTYAVKHIQERKKEIGIEFTKNEEPNAEVFAFSQDKKHIVLRDFEKAPSKSEKENIISLSNLFCFISCDKILSNQQLYDSWKNWTCNEPATVADLIESMRLQNFTADDILKHPYFWNSMKKINFLCSVSQIHQSNDAKPTSESDQFSDKFKEWENKLTIKSKNSRSTDLRARAVAILREKSLPHKCGSPTFELLRFFRNCAVHYWSNRIGEKQDNTKNRGEIRQALENARKVFESEHEGFWNFFSTKFPDLFISAYQYARRNKDMERKLKETGYFSELAPFKDLIRRNSGASS